VAAAARSMKISVVQYRRAAPDDYEAIVRLNAANFRGNLDEEERKDGFLSALFSAEQIAAMAQGLGITVVSVEGKIAGFLCAFCNDFEHGSAVVAEMIASYERMRFEGKTLSAYLSYVYGPVCLDRSFRRKGLLRGLYEAQRRDLAGQFEIGVALVSRDNPHSLEAHVAGLGMTEVGEFHVDRNVYATLAFGLPGNLEGRTLP
jgi:ribosomal protein S18 acetylase RimI-like enzyme